jgi:hypothetical protein
LFSHPNEEKRQEASFIAPHHFPPLSESCKKVSSSSTDSSLNDASRSDLVWITNPPAMVPDDSSSFSSQRDSPTENQPTSPNIESFRTLQQQQIEPKNPQTVGTYPNKTIEAPTLTTNCPPLQQPLPLISDFHQEYPPPMMVDPNTGYPIDPSAYYYEQQMFYFQHQQQNQMMLPYPTSSGNVSPDPSIDIPFNVEANEFVPGVFTA